MKLPTQRIRNFRVAYYQNGKWLISTNAKNAINIIHKEKYIDF